MSQLIDEEALDRVNSMPPQLWSGTVFRHTAARRDPLSGAGARLSGGRWNPKDLFETLYLATPVQTCVAELERLARSQDVAVADLLAVPRLLHTIDVIDLPVLDLSTGEALAAAGLSAADIAADSWSRCQSVGHAAWFLELGGLRAPSASGHGEVIAVFEGRIDPGQLVLSKSEPLTFEFYESLR